MVGMEGSLSKWTNVVEGWRDRWVVLEEGAGLLSYYISKDKMLKGVRRGCVRLRGAVIGVDDPEKATFTITADGKTFHFQAKNAEEMDAWIVGLESAVFRHARRCYSSRRPRLNQEGEKDPDQGQSLEDFDQKLSETDRYLQLMMSQVESLKSKPSQDYSNVVKDAGNMMESVKHAIVLLQIAKNASCPPDNSSSVRVSNNSSDSPQVKDAKLDPQISSCEREAILASKYSGIPSIKKGINEDIPDCSYSSSEDEDFFDAEENYESSVAGEDQETKAVSVATVTKDSVALNYDYDSLYGASDDQDGEMDMKSHGSVITHLLSQVRIGMDLTKIVLPTFILERRSLLEMYSDFFAHPDLFVAIESGSTPEERMLSVLRWYLSSFHAGRKSSIAKKPYNPIIGEIFNCNWKVPGEDSDAGLTFVAEQVSHHPPISAFYAEHKSKGIQVNAHIYTKSSFLGMSIAVHNVGQGSIKLLKYGEEYIVTFPTGYGRSILTVPWIELGGKVSITCSQTNYYSNIEFKCKPFFSSDVNKISAEVFSPNSSKKPVLKVDGEWNGKMTAKWASGKQEVFIDVNCISIIPKHCVSIAQQAPNESRRLWKDVTRNLKEGDIAKATAAKFALEQKQREEAAERKEKQQIWKTKLFTKSGENWKYNDQLIP